MKKYKYKFVGRNGFLLFADWLQYALRSIEENIENILQLRLLRHILGDYYEKHIVSKIMHRQDKYALSFNDAQAVAVAIALHNHRNDELTKAENYMLDAVLMGIMQHLERKPQPINFPELPPLSKF